MLLLRSIAYLIDCFILFILVITGFQAFLLIIGLHPFIGRHLYSVSGFELHLWALATITLPVYIYFVTMFNTHAQATLGMRAARLQIKTRGRIGLSRAMLRAVVMLVPWELTHIAIFYPKPIWANNEPQSPVLYVAITLTLIYWLFPLLNSRGKSIHDVFASTIVAQWYLPQAKKL